MKIRNGFVSNSSSSSFVVYGPLAEGKEYDKLPLSLLKERQEVSWWDEGNIITKSILTLPIKEGNCEFGWAFERWCDIKDKINYLAIQLLECSNRDHDFYEAKQKFYEVLKESLIEQGIKRFVIEWDYNSVEWDSPDCYAEIDHQSSLCENDFKNNWNLNGVFDSKENIKNFIFNPDAYVQGGNDNEDGNDDYYESRRKMYGKRDD